MKKKILITGASKGLGRALSIAMTEKNYDVIATARKLNTLDIQGGYKKVELDVTDVASIEKAFAEIEDVDILINNAAISITGPAEAIPFAEINTLFITNFFGPIQVMQKVIPLMRKRGQGIIVNISSPASQYAPPHIGYYAASKAALELISEEFYFELKHFGIDVMIMQCGMFDTELNTSQKRFKMDEYESLSDQVYSGAENYKKQAKIPDSTSIALEIIRAIENPQHSFKTIIGKDAAYMLDLKKKTDDNKWEKEFPAIKYLKW